MKKTILIFGGLSVVILLLFQLDQLLLSRPENSTDFLIILSGILFLLIGFFVNRFVFSRNDSHERRGVVKDYQQETALSKQEFNVLMLMADGLSNLQIAADLSISENTVKTHVSRVLSKLKAKRRTEAVKIGRDLEII